MSVVTEPGKLNYYLFPHPNQMVLAPGHLDIMLEVNVSANQKQKVVCGISFLRITFTS